MNLNDSIRQVACVGVSTRWSKFIRIFSKDTLLNLYDDVWTGIRYCIDIDINYRQVVGSYPPALMSNFLQSDR